MDIIGSVVGGVETGCQYLSLATKIVGRVARLECWERLADNIKQVYQKCAHLEALKTYIVRPVGFALSTHRVLGLNVLSLATQKGIENITKELGGYANASLLFTPLYRAFSFLRTPVRTLSDFLYWGGMVGIR
ncbi:MAG: hypothetical protein LVR00_06860 [Rhabdochlamydiaceae bacterium]|jgi:hypothetical protein